MESLDKKFDEKCPDCPVIEDLKNTLSELLDKIWDPSDGCYCEYNCACRAQRIIRELFGSLVE